jgi:hypothetical protein
MANYRFLLAIAVAMPVPGIAQAPDPRVQSPYLACAADEADRSFKSRKPIATLQERAAKKCDPLLEANVANSLAAIVKGPSPNGGEYSQGQKLAIKDMLREKLRNDLSAIVENRVTFHRAARAAQKK